MAAAAVPCSSTKLIFFLFLFLLIFPALRARPFCVPNLPKIPSPSSSNRQLRSYYSPQKPSSTSQFHTTAADHTATTTSRSKSKSKSKSKSESHGGDDVDRQFRAAAHEVPSGPNPESNK